MDGINVFWTQIAKKQRDFVFEFWNKRNGNSNFSIKLNLEIREWTSIIKANPEIGKLTNHGSMRSISFRHYSLFYQVKLPQIIITAFWDNRRDPGTLLRFLKEK